VKRAREGTAILDPVIEETLHQYPTRLRHHNDLGGVIVGKLGGGRENTRETDPRYSFKRPLGNLWLSEGQPRKGTSSWSRGSKKRRLGEVVLGVTMENLISRVRAAAPKERP